MNENRTSLGFALIVVVVVVICMALVWIASTYEQRYTRRLIERLEGRIAALETVVVGRPAAGDSGLGIGGGPQALVAGETPTQVSLPGTTPTPTPTHTPIPSGPRTRSEGVRIRTGPGTVYEIVTTVKKDTPLVIEAQTQDEQWYRLEDDRWIAAYLVVDAPSDIEIAETTPTSPSPTRVTSATATPIPGIGELWCVNGCVDPPAGCNIKGVISRSTGQRVYYVPGQTNYAARTVETQFGDRWFCTEAEAVAAGWRRSVE